MTILDLKNLIKDLPENDSETGDPFEVWCSTGKWLSSPIIDSCRLNKGDILLINFLYEESK